MGNSDKLGMIILFCLFSLILLISPAYADASAEAAADGHVWWFWPLVLLVVTFIMGVVAVLAGVGGGVLFVPIISGFFRDACFLDTDHPSFSAIENPHSFRGVPFEVPIVAGVLSRDEIDDVLWAKRCPHVM